MTWQQTPFAWLLFISALISAILSVYGTGYIWRKGWDVTAGAFVAMMVGISIWATFHGLEVVSTHKSNVIWLNKIQHIGVVILPFSWFVLTASYTGRERWLNRKVIGFILVFTSVSLSLFLTNSELHNLMWINEGVPTEKVVFLGMDLGSVSVSMDTFQSGYWTYIIFAYTLIISGIYFIVEMVVRSKDIYRSQSAALLFSSLVPLVSNVTFVFELPPYPLNLTPIAFAVSGVALGYAIFRYRLLDVVPVARNTVVEGMRDGFLVLDDEKRVVDLNPAAKEITNSEDVIGRPAVDILPECADLIREHSHGEEAREEIEVSNRYFDVEITSVSSSPTTTEDERRYVGRLVTFRDITERRGVEKRFQALIENSSDIITVIDEDGKITYESPSIERILGYGPDELVGEDAFKLVHPDDRDEMIEEFEKGVRDPGYTTKFEYRLQHKNGEWRVFEGVGSNLLENPFVEGIVVNSRDITERKEREEELKRTNERLDKFASVVSHDLRNPLNIADGYVEMARDDLDEETYEKVNKAHARMEKIIEDVLTLARHGKDVGETNKVNVNEIAKEAWMNVDTDEARLETEEIFKVEADRDRLVQVFENLFRNAVEHGGENVTVKVGNLEDNGFYIEDDGKGIPPEDRTKVFEHGHTTNENGTGLGLSIVKSIINAHGWDISVVEGRDGGARFEITSVKRIDGKEKKDGMEDPEEKETDDLEKSETLEGTDSETMKESDDREGAKSLKSTEEKSSSKN